MTDKTKHGLTSLEVNRATTVLKRYFEYEYCQDYAHMLNRPGVFDLNDLAVSAEYELNLMALTVSTVSLALKNRHFLQFGITHLIPLHMQYNRNRGLWEKFFTRLYKAGQDPKTNYHAECVEALTQFSFEALNEYVADNFTREDYEYLETIMDSNGIPYIAEMVREYATDYFDYVFSRYVSA